MFFVIGYPNSEYYFISLIYFCLVPFVNFFLTQGKSLVDTPRAGRAEGYVRLAPTKTPVLLRHGWAESRGRY